MLFKDIIGQEEIKKRLIKSFHDNKIAHAQLFAGPEGVGKLQLAIAFAQYINCLNPSETDSCGDCSSCVKFKKLAHPDVHFSFPIFNPNPSKIKKITCDYFMKEWRDFNEKHEYFNLSSWLKYIKGEDRQGEIYVYEGANIIKKLTPKIYEGKFRVMIIWHAEKMNIECANAILKILEEPYPNTIFILITDKPDDILQTIASRTQRLNIGPIKKEAIAEVMASKFNLEEPDADNIAHVARGSYLKALEIMQEEKDANKFLKIFQDMMRASFQSDIKKLKKISEDLAAAKKEKQLFFLNYAIGLFKEYFISNFKIDDIVYLKKDEMAFGEKFAPFVNERNVISLIDEFTLADMHLRRNLNARMVFFDLALKTAILIKK